MYAFCSNQRASGSARLDILSILGRDPPSGFYAPQFEDYESLNKASYNVSDLRLCDVSPQIKPGILHSAVESLYYERIRSQDMWVQKVL